MPSGVARTPVVKSSAKAKARAKRIAMVVAASLVGVSVTTITTSICIYDSVFSRYDRPDYDLYPGKGG
jgi:hypothetical protein